MIPVRTMSGRLLDLSNPKPEMICVEDISWGLANQCRFIGQMRHFYSLAQHTLLVLSLVQSRIGFKAINHDDTEAFMGDMSRFLKHSDFLKGYRILESQLDEVIDVALGIEPLDDLEMFELKAADDLAAVFEHVMLRTEEPFRPERHLPWAIDTGFITRTSLDGLRSLVPKLQASRMAGNGRYQITPMYPENVQRVWMSEFRFLDQHRRTS